MSFSRQHRIVAALVRAQTEINEAMRLAVADARGAPDSVPPPAEVGLAASTEPSTDPQHRPPRPLVPTLSTSHASVEDIRSHGPRAVTRFNQRVTAAHALEEVRRMFGAAATAAERRRAISTGRQLVATRLIEEEALEEILREYGGDDE